MTKSLLSCFVFFLTSITGSANAQDTPANIDTADITTITSAGGDKYLIDKTSGFCYHITPDTYGVYNISLEPSETPIQELESFASSDLVKESTAAASELKNAYSGYAATIAAASDSFSQQLESITQKLYGYPSEFEVLNRRAKDTLALLESYTDSIANNAQAKKNAAHTSPYSIASDGFDIQNSIEKFHYFIEESSRWKPETIEKEIEEARKESEKTISIAASEIARIDSICKKQCLDWVARIDEINERITSNMDFPAIESAKIALWQIIDEINKEADDLYEFMSSAAYYNPWGNLERLIDDCTQSLEKHNPEAEAQKALELAENLRQLDLPGRITENAAREEWTIRIPSTFEYDEEHYGEFYRRQITITRISGNILASTETRATAGNLTVVIPESITLLEDGALASKSVTQVISINPTPPTLDNENPPFTGMMESSKILVVPDGAVNSYRDSDWSRYFAIILPMSVASVESTENVCSESTCEVFSIQGIKIGNSIDNLPKGIYIVRSGNSCRKIMID
jgi:hypothetical protein